MGPELEIPPRDELRLVDVLQALADPVRLELVRLLDESDGQVPCSQLPLPVSKATASHHFKVLREAGVLRPATRAPGATTPSAATTSRPGSPNCSPPCSTPPRHQPAAEPAAGVTAGPWDEGAHCRLTRRS